MTQDVEREILGIGAYFIDPNTAAFSVIFDFFEPLRRKSLGPAFQKTQHRQTCGYHVGPFYPLQNLHAFRPFIALRQITVLVIFKEKIIFEHKSTNIENFVPTDLLLYYLCFGTVCHLWTTSPSSTTSIFGIPCIKKKQ